MEKLRPGDGSVSVVVDLFWGERFSGAKKSDLWKISKGQTAPKLGNMLKKDRWGRFGMFFVWQNFLRSSWSWNGVLSPNPIFDFEKKDNIL